MKRTANNGGSGISHMGTTNLLFDQFLPKLHENEIQ